MVEILTYHPYTYLIKTLNELQGFCFFKDITQISIVILVLKCLFYEAMGHTNFLPL